MGALEAQPSRSLCIRPNLVSECLAGEDATRFFGVDAELPSKLDQGIDITQRLTLAEVSPEQALLHPRLYAKRACEVDQPGCIERVALGRPIEIVVESFLRAEPTHLIVHRASLRLKLCLSDKLSLRLLFVMEGASGSSW
ncbi:MULTISPECIES: hypothetical protein [Mesorhizobium]|uniref:UbiC transcription regulator-associated domain-containing protein n=1 Tax=Mesorhizobium album TaxID=3072314 RepID=A0ABU4Y4P8_9HYPH|nr:MULTISPECIES: hypothetical protein [unclassified Mesorhizobium]MDX8480877.1 hypothetical protein [Mesorhizobium sp. VK24D]MDX8516208.1 hypothetical protein [Mesorhizobium sp. VK23E]